MNSESNGTTLIDEIDRLFVVYDKAKDYLHKILVGIDDQIGLWQHRRGIIMDQIGSPSSFEFLLPKTQRINELSIEAVQALCRVDLLIDQILRLDPKSIAQTRSMPTSTSFSTRTVDLNAPQSTTMTANAMPHRHGPSPLLNTGRLGLSTESSSNGKILGSQSPFPMPVLRTQPQRSTIRSVFTSSQETASFKPIEQQESSIISDGTSRPTPIYPHPFTEKTASPRPVVPSYGPRMSSADHISPPVAAASTSQMVSYNQAPRGKATVKLQRIRPGTEWKSAQIDIIDSLSAFYVENSEPRIHSKFETMFGELHEHYEDLQKRSKLRALENLSIGDFGVAKYSEDNRWYRARVLTAEEGDRIKIVFIDFGNMETIFNDEFFPLDRSFADLPAQVVACTLSEAFPRANEDSNNFWSEETIKIFRDIVTKGKVEVGFINAEDTIDRWPLHFVQITVNNQTVTNILSLKQRIEPKPNRFIAEQLSESFDRGGYILFNIPINKEETAE